MIEQIFNMLKELDPLERERIIKGVKDRLEVDRMDKLNKAKSEMLKYETS